MSYEVTKDRVNYTWVLTQQVGGKGRLATEHWQNPKGLADPFAKN